MTVTGSLCQYSIWLILCKNILCKNYHCHDWANRHAATVINHIKVPAGYPFALHCPLADLPANTVSEIDQAGLRVRYKAYTTSSGLLYIWTQQISNLHLAKCKVFCYSLFIRPGCLRPSIALTVQNRHLKHHSFIHCCSSKFCSLWIYILEIQLIFSFQY